MRRIEDWEISRIRISHSAFRIPHSPIPYTYTFTRRTNVFSPELKKGSTEMLILSLLEDAPRHGYEIGKLIEARSGGRLTFALPTLYPTLLRLENRGLIKGRWVEKAGERERCFYRLTPEGRRVLAEQRATWQAYVEAVNAVMEPTGA